MKKREVSEEERGEDDGKEERGEDGHHDDMVVGGEGERSDVEGLAIVEASISTATGGEVDISQDNGLIGSPSEPTKSGLSSPEDKPPSVVQSPPVKVLAKPVTATGSGRGFTFSMANRQCQVQIKLSSSTNAPVSGYLYHKDSGFRVEGIVEEVRNESIFYFRRYIISYNVTYSPILSGPHELKVEVDGASIPCDPCIIQVEPSPEMRRSGARVVVEGYSKPHSIAVTNDNLIVYSDIYLYNTWSIIICDADGRRIRKFEVDVEGDSLPLAVTHDDHIILLDAIGHNIRKVAILDKVEVTRVGNTCINRLSYTFQGLRGVSVDAHNNIYVTDNINIVKLSPDLMLVLKIVPLNFDLRGVSVCSNIPVTYVCNYSNSRVIKIESDGKWASFGRLALAFPYLVAFDHNIVYVIDKFKRVVMFDDEGEHLGSVGDDYDALFATPTGIAVSPQGTVYVCDHARGTITAF